MNARPPLGLLRFVDTRVFWLLSVPALRVVSALSRSPKWAILLGYALESLSDQERAAASYRSALRLVRRSGASSALRWLQAGEFFLERSLSRLGKARAEDPLFACAVGKGGAAAVGSAGWYKADFVFSGLQILGVVHGTEAVDILLDGKKVRDVNVVPGPLLSTFAFRFTRSALRLFPRESVLSIRDSRGRRLRTSYGSDRVSLRVAHGIEGGGPLLSGERSIDKKGAPKPTPEELEECRAVYRALYSDARAFFRERLGKPLFLAYGTLLGCYRQGGYIEGDDDFDVCYVAEATDPEGVKAETLDMIESLAAAGFGVSFNRMGRLFRLYPRGAGASGAHLDVHSFWLERGKAWAHNDFCAPMGLDRFLPARVAPFDGAEVDLFADPEAFLAAHYGPGWKKPDPGFVNSYSGKDPRVLAHLGRALISYAEFLAVSERLAAMRAENPGTGAFVSIGARDLYPLPGRDEDLE